MQDWPLEARQYIQLLEEKIDALTKELEKVKTEFAEYKKNVIHQIQG
ncbi:MAG: hypothetical protein J7K13_01495 [Thermoplasmata archaeon]|nr:hypothetical protein [Thermoplasmata archaeon]